MNASPGLGYQPALDGLRAVSVIAVVLYHAGFGWMHGGFFGVEVFFVISGFLITTLLLDERVANGSTSLRRFWMRRARRLLPALMAMLVLTSLWGLVFGTAEQASQLKHDLPWAVFYVANWGQILGDVPYFAPVDPPLLRHLWSLAVEEQWYIVWPLVFVAVYRLGWRSRRTAALLVGLAVAVNIAIWFVAGDDSPTLHTGGWLEGADRINVLYLSTPTRSSGLLIGAALAFAWRTWAHLAARWSRWTIDGLAVIVAGALAVCFVVGEVTSMATYPWLMLMVSSLSAVLIALVLQPQQTFARRVAGSAPLASVGRRSYGIYLWHWPVFVVFGATSGSWWRFAAACAVAAGLSEACYRWLETPIRRGAIGRAWTSRRRRVVTSTAVAGLAAGALVLAFSQVSAYDAAVGEQEAAFELPTVTTVPQSDVSQITNAPPATTSALPPEVGATDTMQPTASSPIAGSTSSTTTSTTSTTLPRLPRTIALVGDSQAHSMAVNLPSGVDEFFRFVDGSVDGCSVFESGRVRSSTGFRNDFGICEGWARQWGRAAADADVTLVMLGAWDVFDIESAGRRVPFGTYVWDTQFLAGLQSGLDAIAFAGSHTALLEVGCMRPVEARGAGVPPLPERADDERVAHVNELLRGAAAADPERVTFVEGPDAWCNDEAIATDRDYRWDGVHVYQRGAKLILETVAPALLAIPVDQDSTEVTDE